MQGLALAEGMRWLPCPTAPFTSDTASCPCLCLPVPAYPPCRCGDRRLNGHPGGPVCHAIIRHGASELPVKVSARTGLLLWDAVAERGLIWAEPLLPPFAGAGSFFAGPCCQGTSCGCRRQHSHPPPCLLPFLLCSPLMLLWFIVNATLGEPGACSVNLM